jgi:predicted DNA-binding protein
MAALPTTSIRLPTDLRQRLANLAKAQNRTVSSMMIHILDSHLSRLENPTKQETPWAHNTQS